MTGGADGIYPVASPNLRIDTIKEAKKEDNSGCEIIITRDIIGGVDWIRIRDQEKRVILQIQLYLWNNLSAEIRDSLLTVAREHYG